MSSASSSHGPSHSSRKKWLQRSSSEDSSSASDDVGSAAAGGGGSGKQSGLQVVKPTVGRSPSPYQTADPKGSGFGPGRGATSGNRLAQEIHDEFLVCKICLEGYKNPKCLDCLHTFCELCIDNHVNSEPTYKKYSDYREFTCPLCRKRTQLPVGGVRKLPDNFLVSSLIEVVGRQRPSKYPFCDFCKMVSRKHREATSKCLDCAKLLCANCVLLHRNTKVTSAHSLFDVEIEKEIECKDHSDEVVRFYCEPCDACICVLCTFNEHKDHEISHFNEAVVKYKESLQRLLDTCKQKTEKFDDQVHALDLVEDVMKSVEQRIHDTAIQFIQEIRNQEKRLIEELENIYGTECSESIENKKELIHQAENLRNTCSLTDVILMGKDMELLLLKKDVEEKLNALNALEFRELPSTITKVVDFVTGCVDFGYLQDNDRPMLSKIRTKSWSRSDDKSSHRIITAGKEEGPRSVVETAIQTEKQIGSKVNQTDHATMTDGVGSISHILHSFKGTAAAPVGSVPPQAREDSPDDPSDNSLVSRRRRRRDRGQSGGGGSWTGGSQTQAQPQQPQQQQPSVPGSVRGFGIRHNSDADDVFHDATSSVSQPKRVGV